MTDYTLLVEQAASMIETEPYYVAALSNISALIYESMDRLNWAGFYLMDKGSLLVGPFQGRPACIRIEIGKGVCGTAWTERRTLVVADVEAFSGHIACSSLSKSEIVVPLFAGDEVIGVLDIDSAELSTFDEIDAHWLEKIVGMLAAHRPEI